jgi:hypothetical protein
VRRRPRLRQWLEEDREILVCRQRIGFIIQEWQQTGRDDDFLLRGFELVPGAEVCTPQLLPPIQNKGNNLATSETDTNGYREPDNRDLCERD